MGIAAVSKSTGEVTGGPGYTGKGSGSNSHGGFTAQQEAAARHGLSIGAYDVRSALNQRAGALRQSSARDSINRAFKNYKGAYSRMAGMLQNVAHKEHFSDPLEQEQWGAAALTGDNKTMFQMDRDYKPAYVGGKYSGMLGEIFDKFGWFQDADDVQTPYEDEQKMIKSGNLEYATPYGITRPDLLSGIYKQNRQAMQGKMATLGDAMNVDMATIAHAVATQKISPATGEYAKSQLAIGNIDAAEYAINGPATPTYSGWTAQSRQHKDGIASARKALDAAIAKAAKAYQSGDEEKAQGLLSGGVDSMMEIGETSYEDPDISREIKEMAQIAAFAPTFGRDLTVRERMDFTNPAGHPLRAQIGSAAKTFGPKVAKTVAEKLYEMSNSPGLAVGAGQTVGLGLSKMGDEWAPSSLPGFEVDAFNGYYTPKRKDQSALDYYTNPNAVGYYANRGLSYLTSAVPTAILNAAVPGSGAVIQAINRMNTAATMSRLGEGVDREMIFSEPAEDGRGPTTSNANYGGGLLSGAAAPVLPFEQMMALTNREPLWAKET